MCRMFHLENSLIWIMWLEFQNWAEPELYLNRMNFEWLTLFIDARTFDASYYTNVHLCTSSNERLKTGLGY